MSKESWLAIAIICFTLSIYCSVKALIELKKMNKEGKKKNGKEKRK